MGKTWLCLYKELVVLCCVRRLEVSNYIQRTLPQIPAERAVHTQAVFTPASPSDPVQQFNTVLQYCYAESSIIHEGFQHLFSHGIDRHRDRSQG